MTSHKKTIRILGDINAVKRGTVKKELLIELLAK